MFVYFIGLVVFGIVLILLLGKSGQHLIEYFQTKDKSYLHKIISTWKPLVIFLFIINVIPWLLSDTEVDKERIIGIYEIDDSFYPGKNASWQKEHYRFEIRADSTFILYERLADNTEKEYWGRVNWTWVTERPEKWSVRMDNSHHVIDPHPILYRESFGFYYVFRTQKFGNMFFRKI